MQYAVLPDPRLHAVLVDDLILTSSTSTEDSVSRVNNLDWRSSLRISTRVLAYHYGLELGILRGGAS